MQKCNVSGESSVSCLMCPGCEVTSYCGEECQKKDYPGHSKVCHLDVRERILGYMDVLVQYKRANPNISMGRNIYIDGEYYFIWAISAYGNYCAICYHKIEHCGVNRKLANGIFYNLCVDCDAKCLSLCQYSANEFRVCMEEKYLWVNKLWNIRQIDGIIADVIMILLRIMYSAHILKCTEIHPLHPLHPITTISDKK